MPKVTQAFTSYAATGNREDLSNAIYNIDPFDTPVMSASKRRNVKNRTFDWQTEFLPPVILTNAQFEGFQLGNPVGGSSASTPTTRLSNVTQISMRDATVSGSQEEIDAAGKGSEMAHQMALISKALKSDMESIACGRNPRINGEDATPTARQTESISHWLARATNKAAAINGAIAPGSVIGAPPVIPTAAGALSGDAAAQYNSVGAGSQQPLTEQMLGDAMQLAYTNGASPTLWVLPPGPRRTASTFVGRSTTQVMVGKTEVQSTIDIIATDFGRIKVIPSRWVPTDLGLLLDPDYVAFSFFRAFRQYLMARVGDAETRMIVVEWGIEMRNPLAHIVFNGIKA